MRLTGKSYGCPTVDDDAATALEVKVVMTTAGSSSVFVIITLVTCEWVILNL